MIVTDLGLIEFGEALKIQEIIRDEIILGTRIDTLLVCEHPSVITIGRALGSKSEVFATSLPVYEVSRGGRATLHLPGQVVVYPILNLKKNNLTNLHEYMRVLEEAIIETLGDFRIKGSREDGKTGVWVLDSKLGAPTRKIASLGIAVKKWVSYHGVALNGVCDLSLFSNLSPCGFDSNVMTSVDKELSQEYRKTWAVQKEVLLKNIKSRLVENLLTQLERQSA